MSLRRDTWALLCIVGGVACGGNPARAAFLFTARTSSYDVTYTRADFADAKAHYDVAISANSNPGDQLLGFSPGLKSDHQNLSWVGTGGVTVGNVVDHGTFMSGDLTSGGSPPGGYDFHYDTPVANQFTSPNFGNTWIARGNVNGVWGLEFGGPFGRRGGGAGLLDTGARFDVDITIAGNWSSPGTGPDQSELINVNPTWTIDSNFVFDPISNTTNFHAHVDPYVGNTGSGNDPQIDFILHSAQAVPEPSSMVLAGMGMMGLAWSRRGRRRKPVPR